MQKALKIDQCYVATKLTVVLLFSTPVIDIGPCDTDSKTIRFLTELPAHTAKWYVTTLTSPTQLAGQPTL
jgi:hypothetical protein